MLQSAFVVAVHPQRRTVDIVLCNTGQRWAEVEVCSHDGSTDGGSWGVPSVPLPASELAGLNATGRNVVAKVGFENGRPVVLGFARASGAQVAFSEQDRKIDRHAASGSYSTVAPDGSIEIYHPGGAYVRIGTGSAHEDLTPIAAEGNWSIPAAAAPTVTIAMAGFSLIVQPNGALVINSSQTVEIQSTGDMTLQSGGNLHLTAVGDAELSGAGVGMNATGAGSALTIGANGPVTVTGTTIALNP